MRKAGSVARPSGLTGFRRLCNLAPKPVPGSVRAGPRSASFESGDEPMGEGACSNRCRWGDDKFAGTGLCCSGSSRRVRCAPFGASNGTGTPAASEARGSRRPGRLDEIA